MRAKSRDAPGENGMRSPAPERRLKAFRSRVADGELPAALASFPVPV